MCKYLLPQIILIFISSGLIAQKVTLSGSVKDSLQNPLSYANVIAKPKDVSKNLQFAITDNEGYYSLHVEQGDTLTVSISYLGYKPIDYVFIANKNTVKDFILQESDEQLDEVVIEMPVSVRGDTTIYNTSKFIDGSERKLKNVLKKLPGVEVDKNGGVTVQGRKVTKMLVDDKKFFGGNSKLAVENIPASAVGNVEVIDNYNEVSFLKGLSDSDEMAMNIKLKEDKKRFVFGDIEAGKGNDEFYKASANLFYYSPKTNVNFIGNSNNIGERTFTFRDYMSFSGGLNAVLSGNFNFRGGDFSQFMQSRDVLESEQHFGALNISKTATSKLDVSAYAIFSNLQTTNLIESLNEYTAFTEDRSINTDTDNLLGIGNLNLEYNPNSLERLTLRTQVKRSDNENNQILLSTIANNTNSIITNRDLIATYVNQNLEWHKRKNEKHTFSAAINYTYDDNNRTAFWQTQDPLLQGLIPADNSQELLRIQQLRTIDRIHVDGIFKHFWEINNSNHIYTTIGNSLKEETFFTEDSQRLDDATINDFSQAGFGNDVSFRLNDFFAGMHYKFRTGIFTVKSGAVFHNYQWETNQTPTVYQNKWILLPDFLADIEFNKSKKIKINYNLNTSFSDVSSFANRFVLQSYNSVFRGNEQLANNLFHAARIYYSRFSLYRGLMMHASLNYNKQIRGARNTVDFTDINQFLTVRMFDDPSESLRGNLHIEKTINNLKYKFDVGFNRSNFIQELEQLIQNNKSANHNYEVGIETLFDNFPTIDIGVSRNIGDFTSSANTSRFTTTEPYLNIDYDFLDGVVFNFDYTKSIYKNEALGQRNTYEIANATLSYQRENSGWSFKIKAQNLFNAQFRQSNSFTNFLISDNRTFLLPRIVLFSIGYNL